MSLPRVTGETPLAVLSVDVAGTTNWARNLGYPEAAYVIERCTKRVRRAVETHGGRLVDYQGRKLMAFFANGAEALNSAIEIQQRVSELPRHSGFTLAAGVGLCTGHQAREGRYFPAEGDNPAANLSAHASPGRILLSVPRRAGLFPWLELAGNRVPDVVLSCGKRRLGVFQVSSRQPEQVALSRALADAGDGVRRLRLRFQGGEMMLDENQPIARIGRLPDSDILVGAARCSREHGRVERRGDRFMLVDQSMNGTFVTLEKQAEMFVHRQDILLMGSGLLSIGAPSLSNDAEVIRFQTIGSTG